LALGCAIDNRTWRGYGSALNSYLNFIRIHRYPLEPTPDTLSLFVVYMCHHIQPRSVGTYLSGICNQLEPYFPDVRAHRNPPLVTKTFTGCLRMLSSPIQRKSPLSFTDLIRVVQHYIDAPSPPSHDDLLFVSQITTGFNALLRLGELTVPDAVALRDDRKVTKIWTVVVSQDEYEYELPTHKADHYFEGNKVLCRRSHDIPDPVRHFHAYLQSCNTLFPLSRELWLTQRGVSPTRSFFMRRMRTFFDGDIAGQSIRAGGATFLAECGVPPHLIQARGRWKSETFQIYIRKSPVLLQALLFGCDPNEGIYHHQSLFFI